MLVSLLFSVISPLTTSTFCRALIMAKLEQWWGCDFRQWCGCTSGRSRRHLLASHEQEAGHWLILFHFPLPAQKQEVRLISTSGHRQGPTVKQYQKMYAWPQTYSMHITWLGLHAYKAWFMTKENPCIVSFCLRCPKWAYCFTICRKRHLADSLAMTKIHHISHKSIFSSEKPLMETKSWFCARKWISECSIAVWK